jgi:hypothetical protein
MPGQFTQWSRLLREPDGGEIIGSYCTIRLFGVTAHNSRDLRRHPTQAHHGVEASLGAANFQGGRAPRLGSKLLNAKLRPIADPSTIGSLAAAAAFRTACANGYAQEACKVMAKTRGVKISVTRSRQC